MRKRLERILGYKKNETALQLIGCTISELKQYLEKQFKDNMSWDNYGLKGWHIDHKIPVSAFNFLDEQQRKKCFHYTNLQPLWWYENLQKSDKIQEVIINEV